MIAANRGRLGKTLWTEDEAGEKVAVRGIWDGEAEARYVAEEIENSLGIDATETWPVSAKTGVGVPAVLDAIIERIPPPVGDASAPLQALIFDAVYDEYRGVIVYLRVVDGTDVAFVEQARYKSAKGIKLLRREPLGTYDSILALHLAQMMRAAGGQRVLISREEMHGLFSGVLNDTDRDAVTFTARIDAAIARLTGLEILRRSRDDEDSYTISPVISAIMTASVITELQQQFELLARGGAPADDTEEVELDD